MSVRTRRANRQRARDALERQGLSNIADTRQGNLFDSAQMGGRRMTRWFPCSKAAAQASGAPSAGR